jgi:hypothetical protein
MQKGVGELGYGENEDEIEKQLGITDTVGFVVPSLPEERARP